MLRTEPTTKGGRGTASEMGRQPVMVGKDNVGGPGHCHMMGVMEEIKNGAKV